MQEDQILNELNEIFKKALNQNDLIISKQSDADNTVGWDSLTHIYLIVEIESYYKIKFSSGEIQKWVNVDSIISSIIKKLN